MVHQSSLREIRERTSSIARATKRLSNGRAQNRGGGATGSEDLVMAGAIREAGWELWMISLFGRHRR